VFTTKVGEPLDTSTVTRAFQAALRRAGLPRQRFHDLRHACATLHLEAGEELLVVSRMLGHSTISTTADIYAHITPAMLELTADRMDGILGRKVETAQWGTAWGTPRIRTALEVVSGGRFVFGRLAGEEGFEPSVS
jgi:hypothetical protein